MKKFFAGCFTSVALLLLLAGALWWQRGRIMEYGFQFLGRAAPKIQHSLSLGAPEGVSGEDLNARVTDFQRFYATSSSRIADDPDARSMMKDVNLLSFTSRIQKMIDDPGFRAKLDSLQNDPQFQKLLQLLPGLTPAPND